jgi:hypothetical protein
MVTPARPRNRAPRPPGVATSLAARATVRGNPREDPHARYSGRSAGYAPGDARKRLPGAWHHEFRCARGPPGGRRGPGGRGGAGGPRADRRLRDRQPGQPQPCPLSRPRRHRLPDWRRGRPRAGRPGFRTRARRSLAHGGEISSHRRPGASPGRTAGRPLNQGAQRRAGQAAGARSAEGERGLLPFAWRIHNCTEGGRIYRLEDGCSGAGQGSP